MDISFVYFFVQNFEGILLLAFFKFFLTFERITGW